MKALRWEYPGYTLIGTPASFILQLPPSTALTPAPLSLLSGHDLQKGERVYRLHGKHTGAGFIRFVVDPNLAITYRGIFACKEYGKLACFTQPGKGRQMGLLDPWDWYYAWVWSEQFKMLHFTTNFYSSRVIETDVCEIVGV